MKQGKPFADLAEELQKLRDNSRDYFVLTSELAADLDGEGTVLLGFALADRHVRSFHLNPWAHSQLAQYTDIPKTYYDRLCKENPALLTGNINHGLARKSFPESKESRLVRTYDHTIRALVSRRYRRLDCYDMIKAALPILIENQFEPVSCELTERRMYIKAVTPRIQVEIRKGDPVNYGLVLSSSDVGAGSVDVETLVFRLACLNGLITGSVIRKIHLGKELVGDGVYELLTDETKDLSDAAFWAQIKDIVVNSMKPEIFEAQVDRLRLASNEPIQNFDIPRVVELAARQVGVSGEKTKNDIVAYLANGADGAGLTRWGLANAFTHAAAADHINYDDSTDLERAGARIINLSPSQWSTIAAAPAQAA